MKNYLKHIEFSCLFVSLVFSISLMAEELIIPQGGIMVKEADGEVRFKQIKMKIDHESVQTKLDAGQLSNVKNILDAAVIEDEKKGLEIQALLTTKINEAEQLFDQYLNLKNTAKGDIEQFRQARVVLNEAISIWTDNYSFQQEQGEINKLIKLVETGRYEKWQARENAESEIHGLIAEAKTCEVDSDCVRIGFGCPFGCGTAINKNMLGQINTKVDAYNQDQEMICQYDCYVPPDLKAQCVQNICKLQ